MKRIFAPALLVALAGAILIQLPLAIADRSSAYDWFDPLIEIRHILSSSYVTAPDQEAMRQAAIEGMIGSLNDPYTSFVPPVRRADFEKDLRGTYVGIGAEVNIVDGYLTIISPMDGSPALEAGVMAGDKVLEVDGESIVGEPIETSIARLMGEPNTTVTIRVRRLDGREKEITVTRRRIVTRTVRGLLRDGEQWNYCLDDELGLAYVRISQFNEGTIGDLLSTLNALNAAGLTGLVLDLRDNPGGGLNTAVQVADLFLDAGTIVTVKDRQGKAGSFDAGADGTLPHFPMVVLVNGASASASEIVAGALQENGRARVLGSRTFGKGSVQELRELSFNRGVLKYTTAHYHLPSGRNINRLPDSEIWGVDPDPGFVVTVSDEAYMAMLMARREFEIIRENNGNNGVQMVSCANPSWIRETLKDPQLAAATEALQARVQGNDWPRFSDDEAGRVAFDQELKRAVEERTRLVERLNRLQERITNLHDAAAAAGRPPLLPPDADLLGGAITVRDRHGNVIGSYRIDGGNLELALLGVRLEPTDADE